MSKAIQLLRDEKHTFHVVYKMVSGEFICSLCNPFLDAAAENTYYLLSENEAQAICLPHLSQESASELFSTAGAPELRIVSWYIAQKGACWHLFSFISCLVAKRVVKGCIFKSAS